MNFRPLRAKRILNISHTKIGLIGASIVAGMLVASPFFYAYATGGTVVTTVTAGERVVKGDSSKWLVLTDYTSFENTDSLLHFKFNSSDLQGKIQAGKQYEISYYGLRIPTFDVYPNILGAVEVEGSM